MIRLITASLATFALCTLLTGCGGGGNTQGTSASGANGQRQPPPQTAAPGLPAGSDKQQAGSR